MGICNAEVLVTIEIAHDLEVLFDVHSYFIFFENLLVCEFIAEYYSWVEVYSELMLEVIADWSREKDKFSFLIEIEE